MKELQEKINVVKAEIQATFALGHRLADRGEDIDFIFDRLDALTDRLDQLEFQLEQIEFQLEQLEEESL